MTRTVEPDNPLRALAALHFLDPGMPREDRLRAMFGYKAAGGSVDEFVAWAGDAIDARRCRSAWRSARDGGGVGPGTLFSLARAAGWRDDSAAPRPVTRQRVAPRRPADDGVAAAEKLRRAAAIWNRSLPIEFGTAAHEYLRGRNCVIPPIDGDLRWVDRLELFGLGGPALIGRISDATDARQDLGLHLTWIAQSSGHWARTKRRYLGQKSGGVVRLWPDEAVTHSIAIGEGIETVLCGARIHSPAWAAMDAGNLAKFPVLAGIETIVLFVDRDRSGVGQCAAADCVERWQAAGRAVHAIASDTVGRDIADEVAA